MELLSILPQKSWMASTQKQLIIGTNLCVLSLILRSLGVILYIMLSGSPPFYGSDNKEVLKAVKKGVYTLSLKPFQKCSIEVFFLKIILFKN